MLTAKIKIKLLPLFLRQLKIKKAVATGFVTAEIKKLLSLYESGKRDEALMFNKELEWIQQSQEADQQEEVQAPTNSLTPYSLQCHHGLPDKSVADCVEALIGCYLTTCGRKAALIFMSWLGLRVLPKSKRRKEISFSNDGRKNGKVHFFLHQC